MKAERLRAGGSLDAMARLCGYSRSHLANVEDGRRPATRHIVNTYAEVYPDMLNRRTIIAFLATSAVAAPAVLALDLEKALAADPTAVRDPDHWANLLHTRAHDYMSIAKVGEVRQELFRDLAVLRGGPSTPRFHALTGRFATLYGQTCRQVTGDHGAIGWYQRGIDFADQAGDNDAQVWARARAAQGIENLADQRGLARRWAEEAVAVADRPTTGLVWAHLVRAQLAAGNDRDLAAELDAADRAMESAGTDEADTDYDIAHWRHLVRVSGILAGVGHPRAQAVTDQAARALPALAGNLRYEVHLELHRAAIDHDAGDRSGALDRARRAVERLPAAQQSESVLGYLLELKAVERPRRPIVLKRLR